MIKSMTGFGRGEFIKNGISYSIQIKSINHRYFDINVRVPRDYSFLEEAIKKEVPKHISRGKIDISITIDDFNSPDKRIVLNDKLIEEYLSEAKRLEEKFLIKNNLGFSTVVSLPEVTTVSMEDKAEEIIKDFSVPLKSALDTLNNMREIEGENLKKDILKKVYKLLVTFDKIEEHSKFVVEDYKIRLAKRLDELLRGADIKVEEQRIAIEVALFADRSSIDEEIIRFKSHMNQLSNALELSEPIGKKLDFILQELNREVNTIGSKSSNLEITNSVIEIKNILEQIREQVQNIE